MPLIPIFVVENGEDQSVLQKEIAEQSSQLKKCFDKQEKTGVFKAGTFTVGY